MNVLVLFNAERVRQLLHQDEIFHNFNNGHLVPHLLKIAEELPQIMGAFFGETATLQSISCARILFIEYCKKAHIPQLSTRICLENWQFELDMLSHYISDSGPLNEVLSPNEILKTRLNASDEAIALINEGVSLLDIALTHPGLICVNPG